MPTDLSKLDSLGEKIEDVSVIISYKIIELFSGQLYTSPSKAIEELVVNSYDAFANTCHIYVSGEVKSGAYIAVFDDGEGMDLEGLKELWLIAESRKRDLGRESSSIEKGRLPIGKFGIGKLASYIVGEKITHLTRKNNEYFIVTMDYSGLNLMKEYDRLFLSIRKIDKEDVKNIFESVTSELPFNNWDEEPESWTLVVITELKPRANEIKLGRLKWIISTALPLIPDFLCYLNGKRVEPSKFDETIMKTWIVGKDDETAKKLNYDCFYDENDEAVSQHKIKISELGNIWGTFDLYHNSISTGKSEEIGRSNGFFIMVRGRLINLKNPYFGLPVLSHSTFSRFRAVIYANGLDKYIIVHREDIEQIGYNLLSDYLHTKFNEIRDFYETEMSKLDREYPESYEELPPSLIKYPIRHAVEIMKTEEIKPYVVQPPIEFDESAELKEEIQEVKYEELNPDDPIAKFDLTTGVVKANTSHPFRNSFSDDKSYQTWAIAEAFLEIYMIEAGIQLDTIRHILQKRDKLLRVLVQKGPRPVHIVSQMLRENTDIEKTFETACGDAFSILGFEVTRLGERGKPEGFAVANLGIDSDGVTKSYSLIYDAKSTGASSVQTGNLHISATKRHRNDFSADYSVIIAPGFQDSTGDESAACREARENGVQLIRANDLADLLDYSAVKALPLSQLRDFFISMTPDESATWINSFKEEKKPIPPIKGLFEKIYELQITDKRDPPTYGAVKQVSLDILGDEWGIKEIKDWLTALSRLVPSLIVTEENTVHLEQTPLNIIQQIVSIITESSDPSIGREVISAIS